jgi:hypothetical protein
MTCIKVPLSTLHYYDNYHTVSVKFDTENLHKTNRTP